MILIVLAFACLATVPMFHGRLGRLAHLRVRALWLTPLGLALQVLIVTIAPGGSPTLHAAVHLTTYALIAIFLALNIRLPGVPVIAVGTLANTLAIAANGGVMPAAREAQRLAGLVEGAGFHNSNALAHPHLLWLGDILPVPGPLPNVLSIGDCLIFTGMLILLHRTCGTRLPFGRRRPLPNPLSGRDRDGARGRPPLVEIVGELRVALEALLMTGDRGQAGSPCRSSADRLALVLFDPAWLEAATGEVDEIAQAYRRQGEAWRSSSPMTELRSGGSALDEDLTKLRVALHRLRSTPPSSSVAEWAKTGARARQAWLAVEARARELSEHLARAPAARHRPGRPAATAPAVAG